MIENLLSNTAVCVYNRYVMKSGTKRSLSILSVLIAAGSIVNLIISAIWLIATFRESGFAGFRMAVAIASALAYAVCAVTLGISTISFVSSVRGRKARPVLTGKKTSYMRRAIIMIILALIQIIFICTLGAQLWQIIAMLICTVVFSLCYLLAASTI